MLSGCFVAVVVWWVLGSGIVLTASVRFCVIVPGAMLAPVRTDPLLLSVHGWALGVRAQGPQPLKSSGQAS